MFQYINDTDSGYGQKGSSDDDSDLTVEVKVISRIIIGF